MTTSNLTALLANGSTSLINNTLTRQGEANTILAEQTIKIIYLIIGRFFLRIAGVLCATLNNDHAVELLRFSRSFICRSSPLRGGPLRDA